MAATTDPWNSLTATRKSMAETHKKWLHDMLTTGNAFKKEFIGAYGARDKNGCYKY